MVAPWPAADPRWCEYILRGLVLACTELVLQAGALGVEGVTSLVFMRSLYAGSWGTVGSLQHLTNL